MVKFETDEAVQALGSVDSIDGLASLLSLLSGERIDAEELSSDAKDAVAEILKRVRDSGPDNLHMTYEEFNELLLIFNQNGKLGQTPKLKMKRNCVEFRSARTTREVPYPVCARTKARPKRCGLRLFNTSRAAVANNNRVG